MPEMSSSLDTSRGWLMKLYELDSSGSWLDRGVGRASIESIYYESDGSSSVSQQSKTGQLIPTLCIISENSDEYLLKSRIQSDDLYEKQGERMILWKEADFSTTIDYAMSFHQAEGCAFIFSEIGRIQGEFSHDREYGISRTHRINQQSSVASSSSSSAANNTNEYYSLLNGGISNNNNNNNSGSLTVVDECDIQQQHNMFSLLPMWRTDEDAHQLVDWLHHLKSCLEHLHPSQRDYVVAQLLHDNCAYLRRLFALFDVWEKHNRLFELKMLAEIMRLIFLLNEPNIIEYLVMNSNEFHSVCGIFEYDHTLRERGQYRDFLFKIACRHDVIPLSTEMIRSTQFLFRLRYVRDIMLHPTIDDPGVSAINSLITFTANDIVCQVIVDETAITQLWTLLLHSPITNNNSNNDEEEEEDYGEDIVFDDDDYDDYGSNSNSNNQKLSINRRRRQQKQERKNIVVSSEQAVQDHKSVINAVLFLRELFSLSKFVPLESRLDLYKRFFEYHEASFVFAVRHILSVISKSLRVPVLSSYEEDQRCRREIVFIKEDANRLSVAIAEVCSAISLIAPAVFRQIALRVDEVHPPRDLHKINNSSSSSLSNGLKPLNVLTTSLPSPLKKPSIGSNYTNNQYSMLSASEITNAVITQQDEEHWCRRSFIFLLIDVMTHCDEPLAMELFADTLRHLLEVDKLLALPLQQQQQQQQYQQNALRSLSQSHVSNQQIIWGSSNKSEREAFLRIFYDHYMFWLLLPFLAHLAASNTRKEMPTHHNEHLFPSTVKQSSLSVNTAHRVIFELLIVCLQSHSYRIKYFLFHENVLSGLIRQCFPDFSTTNVSGQVNGLLNNNHNHNNNAAIVNTNNRKLNTLSSRSMQLYAVKVLKHVLQAKDEFYCKYIVKHDLLRPLLMSLQKQLHKDNALTSAIYDLLDYIRTENLATLMSYLVEKYDDLLNSVHQVDVYEKLRVRWEQLQEQDESNVYGAEGSGKRRYHSEAANEENRRLRDSEYEEQYFDEDDDDSHNHNHNYNNQSDQEDKMSIATTPIDSPRTAKRLRIECESTSTLSPQSSLCIANNNNNSNNNANNNNNNNNTSSVYSSSKSMLATLLRSCSSPPSSTTSSISSTSSTTSSTSPISSPTRSYARPNSPPHYQRQHGTDLDGEMNVHPHSLSPCDAVSMLSQYSDNNPNSANNENDDNNHDDSDNIYDDDDLSNDVDEQPQQLNTSNNIRNTNKNDEDEDAFIQLPPVRSTVTNDDEDFDEQSFLRHKINKKKILPFPKLL